LADKTFKIQIKGQVQGVGFRPFVFNLASALKIKGTVTNNERGVLIYCSGSSKKISDFLKALLAEKPEVAIITSREIKEVTFKSFNGFKIIPSESDGSINIPLTPDFAVCEHCKNEVSDAENRRFGYAFTTCVHCGPRYAITKYYPFERAHTNMQPFQMCKTCETEYHNPEDRRFHSQTNSCSSCGVQMRLVDNLDRLISKNQSNIAETIATLLSDGNIIAIKNTNGYLLCCDASNPRSIQTLRSRKKRPNKPFAVLYPTLASVRRDFDLRQEESRMLQSRVAPIVILQNTRETEVVTEEIAPNLHQTGVMLASSTLMALIIKKFNKPIVATSGNIHGSPVISDDNTAQKQLNTVADYLLHHNLDIQFPQDDSVIKFVADQQLILRRSRGLAPNYINTINTTQTPILAMGAHLKSTFTFVPKSQTYVSQYFGNLDSYEVLERYKSMIFHYVTMFETQPQTILVDQHTAYESTILGNELALEWRAEVQEIQHHKAHFTSVLGEHNLFASKEKILGVVWDGMGKGDDDQIWGGEFFTYQDKNIQRLTHFEYYDWLANDKMAKEPRLALFSLLDDANREMIRYKFSEIEWSVYTKLLHNNALKTSSVGRLFDAVASLLDIVDINSYDAEASMRLEELAATYAAQDVTDFLEDCRDDKISGKKIIKALIEGQQQGRSKTYLARSFIYTMAKAVVKLAKSSSFKTIACTGGVFQNSLLVSILHNLTKKEQIELKFNCKLSPNDENISFGQLMYHQYIKN